jgi:hypothetical protein
MGMTNSRSILASSIHFLNDAMELISACEGIEQVLAPTLAFKGRGAAGRLEHRLIEET